MCLAATKPTFQKRLIGYNLKFRGKSLQVPTMRFRLRRRKPLAYRNISDGPPEVIAVADSKRTSDNELIKKEKGSIQKLFAAHLVKLSQKHLKNNRQLIRRRSCLADVSISVDTNVAQQISQVTLRHSRSVPTPKKTPCLGCGGIDTTDSLLEGSNIVEPPPPQLQGRTTFTDENGARSSAPCLAPKFIKCSAAEDSSVTLPTFSSNCFLFGDWCPSSLFRGRPHGDDDYGSPEGMLGCWESSFHFGQRLVQCTPFSRKKETTKKNGIPQMITIPVKEEAKPVRKSSCWTCGADNSLSKDDVLATIEDIPTFDTSLARLENVLKKANLNADIEDKYEKPMHQPEHSSDRLDPTADASTVASSLSTHSSFKVGVNVIRLPENMAPMI